MLDVGLHWQGTKLPLHVAMPLESNVPAQPLTSHDWGLPQVFGVGVHWHDTKLPLHVALPLESKEPAQPFRSHD